jgi:hypothetical protein
MIMRDRMKRNRHERLWLCLGATLVLLLNLALGQSVTAQGETGIAEQVPDDVVFTGPCGRSAPEQPIPGDGRWLQICLLDPLAPEGTTVTTVHIRYLIEHADPNQLEVRLSRDVGGELTLWEQGKGGDTAEFGKATELDGFQGTPSQGYWYLWVRDTEPGKSGWLNGASLVVEYVPVGPLPELLSGTPGRLTSRRLSEGAVPSQTPDRDPEKQENGESVTLSLGGWQEIKREGFEGLFPNAGWILVDDYPDDEKEYLWDDDDYRAHPDPHNPYPWAAWPANGGADGYDPATNPHYPPNMASWMIYGPFDLSDAAAAEVVFWFWRQIELYYDYLYFGISSDGEHFFGFSWSGLANWEEQTISLEQYLGDSSVWVGWLFWSDNIVQYEGPWVDDILIRKYVPGQVTVQGTLTYADRSGNSAPGRYTKVYLYDQDSGDEDELLAETITDENGFFLFPSRLNWDEDDPDPDPANRRLDLYVIWEAEDPISEHRVTDLAGQVYQWHSFTSLNVSDGAIVDFSSIIPSYWPTLSAMWVFQDLYRAWAHIEAYAGIDPGGITARWEQDQNSLFPCNSSCFYAGPGGPWVFIADRSVLSEDTVVHEAGHHYMWNQTGWWLWWDITCYNHEIFSQETERCAWSEGWADFLPLVVNGDPCYDFGAGPCGAGGGAFENLEMRSRNDFPPSFPWGDTVEGRVAGALYDLYDSANEGFDSATFGFAPLTSIAFQAPHEDRFSTFWESWKDSGQNQHDAVRAIYQNTIDYDTPPYFWLPLPDRTVLQDSGWEDATNLGAYSADAESEVWELGWQIMYTSDWRCGVTIDAEGFVDIHPQAGWLGSCAVVIRVSDGIKSSDDTFQVSVVPVQARVYLSIALRNIP